MSYISEIFNVLNYLSNVSYIRNNNRKNSTYHAVDCWISMFSWLTSPFFPLNFAQKRAEKTNARDYSLRKKIKFISHVKQRSSCRCRRLPWNSTVAVSSLFRHLRGWAKWRHTRRRVPLALTAARHNEGGKRRIRGRGKRWHAMIHDGWWWMGLCRRPVSRI